LKSPEKILGYSIKKVICICIYLFRPVIIHMITDSSFIIPFRQVTLFTEPTHTIYTDKFIKFLYTL